MSINLLVGTWRLVYHESRAPDGMLTHPYGLDAQALVTYTAEGYMAVHVMAANRPTLNANSPLAATPAEQAQAFQTFTGYCGTYTYSGDRLIHHVHISAFPNWTGGDQYRDVKFDGNQVTLSTLPAPDQPLVTYIWERLTPPAETAL